MGTEREHNMLVGMVLVLACALGASCAFDGLVIEDQSGFSRGPGRYGVLYEGTRLAPLGEGYWIPPTWSRRGLNYGVDEMASLLVYTGRALQLRDENMVLAIGDISRAIGGRSPWHRSHQTGRDVDLLFFVADTEGRLLVNDTMYRHNPDGSQRVGKKEVPHVQFDVKANWLLVEALLDNPVAEVQYIFVQNDLRQMLLDHALDIGVGRGLVARAAEVMRQPGDSAPHDDHFHVRIYCPPSDRSAGCQDAGQMRWYKRDYKYQSRIERLPGFATLVPEGAVTAIPWLFR